MSLYKVWSCSEIWEINELFSLLTIFRFSIFPLIEIDRASQMYSKIFLMCNKIDIEYFLLHSSFKKKYFFAVLGVWLHIGRISLFSRISSGSILKERLHHTTVGQIYNVYNHTTNYFKAVTRSFRRLSVSGSWFIWSHVSSLQKVICLLHTQSFY